MPGAGRGWPIFLPGRLRWVREMRKTMPGRKERRGKASRAEGEDAAPRLRHAGAGRRGFGVGRPVQVRPGAGTGRTPRRPKDRPGEDRPQGDHSHPTKLNNKAPLFLRGVGVPALAGGGRGSAESPGPVGKKAKGVPRRDSVTIPHLTTFEPEGCATRCPCPGYPDAAACEPAEGPFTRLVKNRKRATPAPPRRRWSGRW
jgi:hypothetical protein